MDYNFISAFDNFDKFTNRIGFILKAPTAFPFSAVTYLDEPTEKKGNFYFRNIK